MTSALSARGIRMFDVLFSVPLISATSTVSSKPDRSKVAPLAIDSVAVSASRSDAPSDSVPPRTDTRPAPAVPFRTEVPPTLNRLPAPRLAFTVAPFSWYSPADSVPVPASVPFRTARATVSLKALRLRLAPLATERVAASPKRSLAPSDNVPPRTDTRPAPAVPFRTEVPPTLNRLPAPRLALMVAPFR